MYTSTHVQSTYRSIPDAPDSAWQVCGLSHDNFHVLNTCTHVQGTYRSIPDTPDSAWQVGRLSHDGRNVQWLARFELWLDAAETGRVAEMLEHAWN